MPPGLSLVPEDAPSSQPQATPSSSTLRRQMDAATLELLRHAATGPAQMADLSAQVQGLRGELGELRASAGRTETALQRLIVLGEEANRLRAEEVEEARQARAQREAAAAHIAEVEAQDRAARAAWWRSLVEPRTIALAVLIVVLSLFGQGSMIPALLAPTVKP